MSENFDKSSEPKKEKYTWLPTATLFFKYSSWIVFPLILALYLGKWLDNKYKTEPWLFLAAVGIAFLISMGGLVNETYREYGKLDKNKKLNDRSK